MSDEIVAPLMAQTGNSEESENINSSKNVDNNNELSNLIEHNNDDIRENINININNNNINNLNNLNQNESHKKGLLFLSHAIQVYIYMILFQKYFDKIDIIKNNYNILFYLSLVFIIFASLKYFRINDDLIDMNIYLEIILAIISSIFMYFFLYKLIVILTFPFIKSIMIITIPIYLYLSLVNFYSYFRGHFSAILLFNTSFLGSWLFIFVLCLIFPLFKIIDKEFAVYDLCIVFILNCISLIHLEFIFKDINIRLRHYPILHISLFIDIFLLSAFYFLIYLLYKKRQINSIKYT